jgi:hypothetical protein
MTGALIRVDGGFGAQLGIGKPSGPTGRVRT